MRCNIGWKQPEKMTRWTMFSEVVYYHCSEFQILRPLNGLHISVLSLYPNYVQNQAWFCLHFSDHSKPKQTDVIFSRFVSLSLVNHGRLPRKNWPRVFPSVVCFTNTKRLGGSVSVWHWRKTHDTFIAEIQRQHCLYIPKLAVKNFGGSFYLAIGSKNKL